MLTLIGIAIDVWLHQADTHLASHETPLTLANFSHVLLMLGFGGVTAGVSAAIVLAGHRLRSATQVAIGVGLLIVALLVGLPAVYVDNMRAPPDDQHEATPLPGTMPGMTH